MVSGGSCVRAARSVLGWGQWIALWLVQLDWDSVAEIRSKAGGDRVELVISTEILRVLWSQTSARFQIGRDMWVLKFMIENIYGSHKFVIMGYWLAE